MAQIWKAGLQTCFISKWAVLLKDAFTGDHKFFVLFNTVLRGTHTPGDSIGTAVQLQAINITAASKLGPISKGITQIIKADVWGPKFPEMGKGHL